MSISAERKHNWQPYSAITNCKSSTMTPTQNAITNAEVTISRTYRDPRQTRKALGEAYDEPITDREEWWRSTMKETPIPGTYDIADFIDDIGQRQLTYSFKSNGRLCEPMSLCGTGGTLLPGAYQHHDLMYDLKQSRRTYSFKSSKRLPGDINKYGIMKDQAINISPDAYKTEKYLCISASDTPSRQWFFKSASQRLPTKNFKPKEGPGPGKYESLSGMTPSSVTSSFKSKTPRFTSAHTRVPGPGTYEKTYQSGKLPNVLSQMGRQHGLFFTSSFF